MEVWAFEERSLTISYLKEKDLKETENTIFMLAVQFRC